MSFILKAHNQTQNDKKKEEIERSRAAFKLPRAVADSKTQVSKHLGLKKQLFHLSIFGCRERKESCNFTQLSDSAKTVFFLSNHRAL